MIIGLQQRDLVDYYVIFRIQSQFENQNDGQTPLFAARVILSLLLLDLCIRQRCCVRLVEFRFSQRDGWGYRSP